LTGSRPVELSHLDRVGGPAAFLAGDGGVGGVDGGALRGRAAMGRRGLVLGREKDLADLPSHRSGMRMREERRNAFARFEAAVESWMEGERATSSAGRCSRSPSSYLQISTAL
jgi:hypothetical protein